MNSYHGPAWVAGRPMRELARWAEHRGFMNTLPDGILVVGGPADGHGVLTMLVVPTEDLAKVHRRLDPDPWVRSGHRVEVIVPWESLIGELH